MTEETATVSGWICRRQRRNASTALFNRVGPAPVIGQLAPLNTRKSIVQMPGHVAYFSAVYGIFDVLIAKLAYRGNHRRSAAAPSLFKLAVFQRLAELVNAVSAGVTISPSILNITFIAPTSSMYLRSTPSSHKTCE